MVSNSNEKREEKRGEKRGGRAAKPKENLFKLNEPFEGRSLPENNRLIHNIVRV